MRQLLQAVTIWEWLLLLLLLPLLFLSPTLGALSLLLVPLLWCIRKITTGRFFPHTPYNITLLVLVFAFLLSLFAIFDLALALPKIGGLVIGIALYFAAVEHCRQRKNGVWHILAVVIAAGTAIALFAIPFTRWHGPAAFLNQVNQLLPQRIARLPGAVDGLINLNEVAGVLAWIVPLLGAVTFGYRHQLWHSEKWYAKPTFIILLIAFGITLLVMLASGSRGGIASVFIAVLVMLAINYSWGRWLLLAGLIGAIALLVVFGPDQLLTTPTDAAESLGLQGRMEIWSRGLEALEEFPLSGLGMNGFRVLVHAFYPLTLSPPYRDIGHAHNHLLQAGLDLGLVGLIAYLSIWILSAGLLWNGLRVDHSISSDYRLLLTGLAGSLTAAWVFGILDAIALGARPGFIWWLLIALVAASYGAVLEAAAEPATTTVRPAGHTGMESAINP